MAKSIKFFLIGCVIFYRIVSLNEFLLLLQKSNEESTDLSSQDKNHSTGEKRNSDAVTEEVEPAAKKLKTCEDQAPSEETTSESPVPPAPKPEDTQTQSAPAANPAPQVAVWEVEKNRKKNDIYIINIQPKNTRKERIQWKHTDYTTDT